VIFLIFSADFDGFEASSCQNYGLQPQVPSQKGAFVVFAQPHSAARVSRIGPAGPSNTRSPRIRTGPSSLAVIVVGESGCSAGPSRIT
jgi:hypothetical protein